MTEVAVSYIRQPLFVSALYNVLADFLDDLIVKIQRTVFIVIKMHTV